MTRSPIKFIFFADAVGLPVGMAATQRLVALARGLREAGGDVEIFILRPTEMSDEPLNRSPEGSVWGIPYHYTTRTPLYARGRMGRRIQEARGLAAALRALWRKKETERPIRAVTYSRHLSTVIPLSLACRRRGIPLAVELCEWPETQQGVTRLDRWRKRMFCRHVTRFADGVIPISRFITERVSEQALALGRKVPSLHVPILVDAEESFEEETIPFMDGPFLLFSGSAAYRETIDFILRAFQQIVSGGTPLKLVITGMPGGSSREVGVRAGEMGLAEHVVLPGFISRNALLTAYRRAEALLVPLFGDARSQARCPTKLGEYLMSGRPVVTTATGEIPSLLADRWNAFLSPPDSVEGYAEAVMAALADPDRARRVGEAGRHLASVQLDYRVHGRRLMEWLGQLGSEPSGDSL